MDKESPKPEDAHVYTVDVSKVEGFYTGVSDRKAGLFGIVKVRQDEPGHGGDILQWLLHWLNNHSLAPWRGRKS